MNTLKKYEDCKNFGFQSCPHIEDKVMVEATQTTPQFYGKPIYVTFPKDDEINAICASCDSFIPKK